MQFEKILKNTDCKCLDGATENNRDVFARLLKKNETEIREKSFKSKYEESKEPRDNSCKSICTNRAVSLALINERNQEKVLKYISSKFKFSPKYKSYFLAKIKLKKNAGIIKQMGSQKFHYDFYKSDEFTIKHIELIEKINMLNNVQDR